MQKVEGSNPFSRSREGLHLQVFFVGAAGWCVASPDIRKVSDGTRTRARLDHNLCRRG